MDAEKDLLLVKKIYTDFTRGDAQAILGVLYDNIDWFVSGSKEIPYSGQYKGHEEVLNFFQSLGNSIEVVEFEPKQFVQGGGKVIVFGREKMRVKKTGRTFEDEWIHTWDIREGKVIAFREYFDEEIVAKAFA